MERRKRGRPPVDQPVYTPEIVDELCFRLMGGETLIDICKDAHMPHRDTIQVWIRDKPDFYEQYLQARRVQMELYVDEIISISDNAEDDIIETMTKTGAPLKVVNKAKIFRDRLRVDSRKWLAAHLAPNLYGDKARIELSGSIGNYDLAKLSNEQLVALEQLLLPIAVNTAAPTIEGFALLGRDQEGEPEEELF